MKSFTSPMLAKNLMDHLHSVLQELENGTLFAVQPKLNGVRAIFTPDGFVSRTGKPIGKKLFQKCSHLFGDSTNMHLDGEIWCKESRGDLNVILSMLQDDDPRLKFYAFDIPVSDQTFENRFAVLETIYENYCLHSDLIQIVPTLFIHKKDQLDRAITLLIDTLPNEAGYFALEGVMIRRSSGLYKPGRSSDLLKYKIMHSSEVCIKELHFMDDRPLCASVIFNGAEMRVLIAGTKSYWSKFQDSDVGGLVGTMEYNLMGTSEVPQNAVLVAVRNYE